MDGWRLRHVQGNGAGMTKAITKKKKKKVSIGIGNSNGSGSTITITITISKPLTRGTTNDDGPLSMSATALYTLDHNNSLAPITTTAVQQLILMLGREGRLFVLSRPMVMCWQTRTGWLEKKRVTAQYFTEVPELHYSITMVRVTEPNDVKLPSR
jgi:hypothetical protein